MIILIFSPVSGGIRNPSTAIEEIRTHGIIYNKKIYPLLFTQKNLPKKFTQFTQNLPSLKKRKKLSWY